MKRYLPIGFLMLGLAGCSKNTPDPEPKPAPRFVSWMEDGKETTTQLYMSGTGSGKDPAATVLVSGRINELGVPTTKIRMEVPPAVGTYAFGPASLAWAYYEDGPIKYFAGAVPRLPTALGSGSITVTEFTGSSISGTFTFIGVDPNSNATKTITKGKFYVPE